MGDATVLAVHDALRRDVRRRRAARRRCSRHARRHRRPRQRPRRTSTSTGARAWSAPTCGSPTTRRCAGWPSGWPPPAAAGSTTPRRTSTCGSPTAPACTRCSRPSRRRGTCLSLRVPRRAAFSLDDLVAAGVAADAAGARLLRDLVGRPAGLPGQRRHRAPARRRCWRPCSAWSIPPSASCWSRTPPSCAPDHPHVVDARGAAAQRGGRRRGHAARPRAAGAADAPRPARRRRGPRRRGHRPAGRAQHRSRGRLRHHPRQLGRATSPRGSRRWRWPPGCRATRRTASSPRPSTRSSTSVARQDGRRRLREVAVPERGPDGLVAMRAAVAFDGRTRPGRARRRRPRGSARPMIVAGAGRRGRRPPGWPAARPRRRATATGDGRAAPARLGRSPSRGAAAAWWCSRVRLVLGGLLLAAAGAVVAIWAARGRAARQAAEAARIARGLRAPGRRAGRRAAARRRPCSGSRRTVRRSRRLPRRSAWEATCRRRCARRRPPRARRPAAARGRAGRSPTASGAGLAVAVERIAAACAQTSRPPGWWPASWPPPARRRSWSPSCRCSPWRWAAGPAASPWAFLLTTPLGLACLAGGLLLALAGLWWIEALTRGCR